MKLTCKDIDPTSTCDHQITGDTRRDVATKMLEHAKVDHKDSLEKMNMTDEKIMEVFESKVRE